MAKLPIQRLKVEYLERKLFMERETHPEPFFSSTRGNRHIEKN